MRNAQQLSLSQLLSADSTTSSIHTTNTVSMAVGQNSSANAAGYNNMRSPYPGAGTLMNNTDSFIRDMATLNRTTFVNSGGMGNNNVMQPINGQLRFNVGGQQPNGTLPIHLQTQQNMLHGPLVNGMANTSVNMQSLRHSVPNNGNLSNIGISPSAQDLHANHLQHTSQQLHNSQVGTWYYYLLPIQLFCSVPLRREQLGYKLVCRPSLLMKLMINT